jgi:hypothetical protein
MPSTVPPSFSGQVHLLRDRLQFEYQQVLAGAQLDGLLELPDAGRLVDGG